MANNYSLFSVEIPNLSEEERQWLRDRLRDFYDQHPDSPEEDEERLADEFCLHWNLDDVEDWPGFSHQFDSHSRSMIFYSEDSGNSDTAANLIHEFLKKFRPDDSIGLEVAFTCSRARPGEFGGAAAFITADKVEWSSTIDWLQKMRAKFEKRKEKKSGNAAGGPRRGQLGQ